MDRGDCEAEAPFVAFIHEAQEAARFADRLETAMRSVGIADPVMVEDVRRQVDGTRFSWEDWPRLAPAIARLIAAYEAAIAAMQTGATTGAGCAEALEAVLGLLRPGAPPAHALRGDAETFDEAVLAVRAGRARFDCDLGVIASHGAAESRLPDGWAP